MRITLSLVILSFLPLLSFADTWSDIRPTVFGSTITFTSTQYELSINWPDSVVVGETLLFTIADHKFAKMKSYRNYDFKGIESNSLKISVRGAHGTPESSSAKDDPSIADTYYLERFSDSSFYFIVTEIKGKAFLKITASKEHPGKYDVQFMRAK